MFFPTDFNEHETWELYETRKQRLITLCDFFSGQNDVNSQNVYDIEKELLQMFTPKNFMGSESIEIEFEKNFHFMCHGLSQHTNSDVKKMTVVEIYTLIENIKRQSEKLKT